MVYPFSRDKPLPFFRSGSSNDFPYGILNQTYHAGLRFYLNLFINTFFLSTSTPPPSINTIIIILMLVHPAYLAQDSKIALEWVRKINCRLHTFWFCLMRCCFLKCSKDFWLGVSKKRSKNKDSLPISKKEIQRGS